ncbi:MAG: radical SAM protein, partial [Desulfobacterales bacterium]|nr:radical SAM protein [Desulfobacterales bacterium]
MRPPSFWETLKEALGGSRRPIDSLQVEITTRCTGRCRYCPHTLLAPRWRSGDLGWEAFARLWPLLRKATRVHLQGWGEPLLHPDFFKMAALARKAGCAVSTTTCGLHMSDDLARRLVDSGIDIIAFSLVGTDAASNAARTGISFEAVCAAIEQLQQVRRAHQGVHLELHIAYLMLASSMEAVQELPALMQRLGVHAAVVSTLDYLPAPHLATDGFACHETEKLARAKVLLQAAADEARRWGVAFHYGLPDPSAPGTRCRENPQRALFIGVDGGMSPCTRTQVPLSGDDPGRQIFGNIHD